MKLCIHDISVKICDRHASIGLFAASIAVLAISVSAPTIAQAACNSSGNVNTISSATTDACNLDSNGESLSVTSDGGIALTNSSSGLTIEHAAVTASTPSVTIGSIVNNGTITAIVQTDSSSNGARGIEVSGGGYVSGGIINNGTITVSGHGIELGYYFSTGPQKGQYGRVDAAGGSTDAIVNNGTITVNSAATATRPSWGDEAGIRIGRSSIVNGNIVNNGTINSYGRGIALSNNDGVINGNIINNGNIITGSTGDNYKSTISIYTNGQLNGSIINTNSIESTTMAAISNSYNITGDIINSGTVTALGTGNTAQVNAITNSGIISGTVVNSGTITAKDSGVYNSNTIGKIINSAVGTVIGNLYSIQNEGTISEGIDNYGILNGDVALSAATINLLGNVAKVNGDITGDDDSVINVGSDTQTADFNAEGLATVGAININNGSVLTLNDGQEWIASSSDGININSGGTYVSNGDTTLSATIGSLTNSGTIQLNTSTSSAGNTLTVNADYIGNSGTVYFNTALGDDNSSTDRLVVNGGTSGTSSVRVTNAGGLGAQTVEGIKIIDVAGNSAGLFTLLGNTTYEGDQAVVGGAYAYRLYQGGTSTPTDGDWYLRSSLIPTDPENPENPLYQPGVPSYEAYPQALLGLNGLPTLQQRVGNRYWNNNGNRIVAEGADPIGTPYAAPEETGPYIDGNGIWGRIEGASTSIEPRYSTSGTYYDQNVFRMQAGLDGLLLENENGKLIGGITVHYAHSKTDTDWRFGANGYGDGEISTDGYGFGGTLTWYGENGFYLDGQAQITWYNSDLSANPNGNLTEGNDGFGYALSVESGKRIKLDQAWSVTPQAQLVYSSVDFDSFKDTFGTNVSLDDGDSLQGRLGLSLEHQNSWYNNKGTIDRTYVYGIANLYYEFLKGTKVTVEGASFASEKERLWGGVGIGGSYNWDNDKYSVYGEGLVNTSLNNFGDSYSLKGTVGFRVKW